MYFFLFYNFIKFFLIYNFCCPYFDSYKVGQQEVVFSAESSWDPDGFIVLGGGEDDISDVLFSITNKLDRWVF
jgi:hypothetical protein